MKKFAVAGTQVVPSFCAIFASILWYVYAYTYAGEWSFGFSSVDFSAMTKPQVALRILQLAVPVVLFFCVLFLAEVDLRFMIPAVLMPIAVQGFCFVYYLVHQSWDYIYECPIQFVSAFLIAAVFLLTVAGVIRTKWVTVAVCGVAILLPLILTAVGYGEFAYRVSEDGIVRYWSDFAFYALYPLAIGSLAAAMKRVTPEELAALKESKKKKSKKDESESVEPSVSTDTADAPVESDFAEGCECVEVPESADSQDTVSAEPGDSSVSDEVAGEE